MEEELIQGGVCGGNWWNSSRNLFGSSPCSSAINDFGWFNRGAMKTAVRSISTDSSAGTASDCGSSGVLQDVQNLHHPTSNGNMSVASTLQMMGIPHNSSSTTSDDHLNQDFLHESGTSQQHYSHILQAVAGQDSSMNHRRKTTDEWNFCADSSINSFRQCFPIEQHNSNSFISSSLLFDADSQEPNYSSSLDFVMNSAEFLPMRKPSLPQHEHRANNFQFVNNTPFWNANSASSGEVRAGFLPSTQAPQLIPSSLNKAKINPHNRTAKHHNVKVAGDADSGFKKGGNEAAFKRPRIETPSPLPTFKVRKEKLGDRVTALQQLVSPFGKTDTASVLHEAIEYIKLLHDQVTVLSTPYLKNESQPLQRQQASDKIKDHEEPMKDLKSRGLCLVPISSTFPVAAETTADFWTPTFGGSFR